MLPPAPPHLAPRLTARARTARPPFVQSTVRAARDGRLALLLATCVPLVLVPGGLDRFTLPKLTVAACAVVAAALVPRRGVLPRPVLLLLGLGAAWLVVAALVSEAPFAQVVGRWPRYEGLIALPVYAGVVWAGARVLGPGAPERVITAWARMLSVASLVLAAVSVLEASGLRPLGGDVARPGALLGNATDQGICGMVLVALLAPHATARLAPGPDRRRSSAPTLVLVGVLSALTVVVVSGSRGALLGTVAACVVLAITARLRDAGAESGSTRPPVRTSLVPLGLLALGVAGAFAVPASRGRLTGTDPLAAATVTGRADLWGSVGRMVVDRPLVGSGPSGFVDAYPLYRSAVAAQSSDPSLALDSPHAWPLQAVVAGGAPLLLLTLALALSVLVLGARAALRAGSEDAAVAALRPDPMNAAGARRPLVHGSLAAATGAGLALATHFTSIASVALVGLAVGALVAVPPRTAAPRARRPRVPTTRSIMAAGGFVAVVLALASAAEIPLARATAAAAAGDVASADASFDLARTLRPWDGDLALIAAQTFSAGAQAGDEPSARATVEWAERSLDTHPSSVEARVSLALGHLALGDHTTAAQLLDEVLVRGDDPRARLLRGVAAARSGDLDLAREHLSAAARNPLTADLARQNLAVLESVGG